MVGIPHIVLFLGMNTCSEPYIFPFMPTDGFVVTSKLFKQVEEAKGLVWRSETCSDGSRMPSEEQ